MFATLKNKIKEETGDDVVQSANQRYPGNNNNNYRLRSRRVSINSNSADDVGGGGFYNESEQLCELRSQCNELTTKLSTVTQGLQQLQEEKTRVDKTNEILLESVRVAQTQKDIYCEEQEKIQNLQQIEIDKLKNLLSFREQESVDRMGLMRQQTQQIESLSEELERLRPIESVAEDLRDELEQLRHSTQQEKNLLTTTLAAVQEENRHLKKRMKIVEESRLESLGKLNSEQQVQALIREHKLLEQHLEEAHLQLSDIKGSWSGQNLALETQVSRLSKQVAEETTEKRKALKSRDDAIESRKQVSFELEKAKDEIKQRDDKVKLLEEEIDELSVALKECREENEQQVLFERNKSQNLETEVKDLKTRLTAADDRFSEYSSNAEQVAQKLRVQVTEKQEQLDETIMQLEIEREEKMTAILRNAEIAQSEDILRQQLRLERSEASDLQERNNQLVRDISEARQTLQQVSSTAQDNADKLTEFERVQLEIIEKNKTIKTLNQRLIDLKKTVQKELRSAQISTDSESHPTTTPGHRISSSSLEAFSTGDKGNCVIMDEVNFQYLKHVIVEARHLVRAVSTLLQLTTEEEKLLHDTLNWKMSWFGMKPT
uniref:Golgin 97, isoform B n=1 Tax=Drosophila melanogaster TaxID=7227 RepID=A0A0B4K775_DROME|nr:golgin 97, isoform B [Drosophila melanogaster]AFH08051.1 golgin 97, isoform B [Drosophila melanogaster]|eukprot:NP_001246297.1 centrosomin's beautiful sister, isoform B [Drosophila melanogaster]